MKVAVYTIALNEAAHVERWANSVIDADYRIVADTGSTDDTVERLKRVGVTVHRIAVRPWRFDVARNAAMALIPDDVDICCSMDMDRWLAPDWRPKLEAAWTSEVTALFCKTIYRASVDDPTPLRSWPAKNFHHRWGYRFRRPVHEALFYSGDKEVTASSDDIAMYEVQDLTKSTRQSYLPLMEVAHKEDPNDAQICFWLGRDLMWAKQHDRSIELLQRYLALPTSTWGEERSEAMRFLARMQDNQAIMWLEKARVEAPHRREIWHDLAEQFFAKADWPNLFWACTNGIEKTRPTNSYLDDRQSWGFRLYDLGAIAAWHLKVTDRATAWAERALELDLDNQRLRSNFEFFARQDRSTKHEVNEDNLVPEQAWYAKLQDSRFLRELRDEDGFVRTALAAFHMCPDRPEPLNDLANYYLTTQRGELAAFYAEAALSLPLPESDSISVDESLYKTGLRHTFAVAANWTSDSERRERGRKVCDWLALSRETPEEVRKTSRYNSGWYTVPLESLVPSLQFHPFSVAAPEGFRSANISICRRGRSFAMTVRAVNYSLINGFHVKGDDPSFRSRMFLVSLDSSFRSSEPLEIAFPRDLPILSTETLGFEDPRPFVWREALWCVSSVRQVNKDARPEMVLARIDETLQDHPVLVDWQVLPSGMPPRWEKNWMPQVIGDELRFIYSVDPTRLLSVTGLELINEPARISAETFFGGSQAVPFDQGWLTLIHEFEWVDRKRRYFHRFIWLDEKNHLRRVSRRFYMRIRGYEFVAGMAWHVDERHLVISFSVNDADPFLAIVDSNDVRAILLDLSEHEKASGDSIAAGKNTLRQIA